MNRQLKIGWAKTDITPDRPVYVIGQLYSRISSYVHDALTATCLVLENGAEQMIMVSCDMASVPIMHIERILKRLDCEGLDPAKVVFNATHTHNATMFTANTTYEVFFKSVLGDICPTLNEPDNILKDAEAEEWFIGKMVTLITDAWDARLPGGVSLAHDYAAVAFNRRPQFFEDGQIISRMYGSCADPSFLGFEGASDHAADMLYTWDTAGHLTGTAVCIPCPSQVYELHSFLSADYWAEARNAIRGALGNIFILPLCGAAGDQNPLDLVLLSKTNTEELKIWNRQETEVHRHFDMLETCKDIGERISEAVVRGYRKARNRIETRPVFLTSAFTMDVALRCVAEADVIAAQKRIDSVKAKYTRPGSLPEAEMIRCFVDIGYINRWKLQNETTRFHFPVYIFRLGRAVFATNPFELYVDYSFRMKARCKADQAFIIQLSSNAKGGYLPTTTAVAGGSYGALPVSTMVGPDGGAELVEKTLAAMDALWP
ncbi:MAG: hypothetical protein M0P55_10665 [Clostridiales bacterium]|nr:hypothetical protein [Clostridiales bacterium]